MTKTKLSTRVSILIPVLVGVLTVSILSVTFIGTKNVVKNRLLKQSLTDFTSTLSRAQGVIEVDMRAGHLESSSRFISGFGVAHEYTLGFATDYEGTIFASTNRAYVGQHWRDVLSRPTAEIVARQQGEQRSLVLQRQKSNELLGVANLCVGDVLEQAVDGRCGVLFLSRALKGAYLEADSALFNLTARITVSIVFLCLLLILALHFLVHKPLGHLLKVSNAVAAGDVRRRSAIAGNSELAQLGQAMNTMLDQLEADTNALNKLSYAIEQSPASVVITNIAGNIEYVNPKFEEITGYSAEEVMGKNPRILKSGETPKAEYRKLWKALASGGSWRGELHNKRKDGSLFWESALISAVKSKRGRTINFLAIKEDITEQKRLEARINQFGRIVEKSLNEVYLFDAETIRLVQVNEGALNNLGYSLEELKYMTFDDLAPGELNTFAKNLAHALWDDRNNERTFERTHHRKDGSTYHAEVQIQFFGEENPPLFVAVARDITEKRQLSDQLRRVQKMDAVGKLAGGIAHDFNNILGIILGNLELLERMLPNDEKAQTRVSRALAGTERGIDLVSKLLGFARKKAAKEQLVDVGRAIVRMEQLFAKSLTTDIEIVNDIAPDLWQVQIDLGDFENVIINLALNARDAMPTGGKMSITVKNQKFDGARLVPPTGILPGDYVLIDVTDTGIGMSEEILEEAIEPFFTTKELGKGTGLGLSSAFGFVQRAGGYLRITSTEGNGTTVKLYLPRTVAREGSEGQYQDERRAFPRGVEKILLAEDEEALRELVEVQLTSLGYEVLTVANAYDALAMLQQHDDIKLLITDIIMPGGMDGYQLSKTVKIKYPHIKVLTTSGYTGKIDLQAASREQNPHMNNKVPMLRKPFTKVDLSLAVREALDS